MRAMMPIAAAAAVLLLAGCSAGPSHDAVTERFQIELEAATDGVLDRDNAAAVELAEGLADDALDGNCGEPTYWVGLAGEEDVNESLVYAWAATCSMYFEGDMSESQRELARELLIEQATADIGE